MVTGSVIDEISAKKCEMYDVDRDEWSLLPDLNIGRYSHATCVFSQRKAYVFGGFNLEDGDIDINSIEVLNLINLNEGWIVLEQITASKPLPSLGNASFI